jgi:PAS domain S-box-containing protein
VSIDLVPIIIGLTGGGLWLLFQYWRFYGKINSLKTDSFIKQVEIDQLQIYKTVVQNSPDLFVIVDQSLQVIVANRSAADYSWMSGKHFDEATIDETAKLHFEFQLKKVLQSGATCQGEIRINKFELNIPQYYKYQIFPVKNEEEEVIGATMNALDVTAQREAETELNRQREFAEGIMNAIPDPIYVKDENQKYLYGNNSFSEIVGQKYQDFIGLSDEEIFSKNLSVKFKLQDNEVMQKNVTTEVEEELSNFEGKSRTVLTKRVPFYFQSGQKVLIAVMRDFSERKRLESELQISKSRQEEAARLATLGEAAGGIAHEINNPLNVLVGVAELMMAKFEKDGLIEKEKLVEYCEKIVKYSMRIAKIVKGLRSISRDASQDPFAEVSLSVLLDETFELCRQQFATRGIALVARVTDVDISVLGRFAQLSQIIMNLLNNARDAIDGKSEPTIYVEVTKNMKFGILRVWDSGDGVPTEIDSKVMNPFFTTKPAGKGTGLGLSISNSIAHSHGGSLRLNREISGSCFELQLPLFKEENKKVG